MSMAMINAFKRARLKPSARFVAITLANYHNSRTGECKPSIATISNDTGLSERHIARILRSMEGSYIVTTPDNGRGNSYTLFPKGDANNPRHDVTPTPDIQEPPPLTSDGPTPDICDTYHYKGTHEPICSEQVAADFLFDIDPNEPPPKPNRPSQKNPDADPRHKPITKNIQAAYEEVADRAFEVDWGRFGKALNRFLSTFQSCTVDDFLNTLQEALSFFQHPKAFYCPKATDIYFFMTNWHHIRTEIARLHDIPNHKEKPIFAKSI